MIARPRQRATRIRALVSDVDGSLVTDDKKLTADTRNTVAQLRDRGIAFSVISSRPPRGLREIIETLGIAGPVAGFNGGAVFGPDLAPIAEHVLPPETARDAVERLAREVEVWVFSGGDWLVRDPDGAYVEREKRTVGFFPTPVGTFEPAFGSSAKIVGVSQDFELLSRCEAELRDALGTQANVVRSQGYYLDITHPLANKGDALSRIAALLGAPLDEIAVIGDGANDVAMFERSGLAIAMGNAAPEVQAHADFVTASNRDNGFAKAVEQLRPSSRRRGAAVRGRPLMTEGALESASRPKLEILPDPERVYQRVADWILSAATASKGDFAIALSGGSTPRGVYELLARPPYRDAFPWARTHVFWGDERFVPHDDPQSNFRMAREALLAHVPIPARNIHPVPTENSPETAADAYRRELADFYGSETLDPEKPLFAVTLLGLGADGHTASLFPGGSALAERELWVAPVSDGKGLPRITLTYPAIESSSRAAFLVAGREKRAIFARLRQGDSALPAAHVHPTGELWLFADAAAAPAGADAGGI